MQDQEKIVLAKRILKVLSQQVQLVNSNYLFEKTRAKSRNEIIFTLRFMQSPAGKKLSFDKIFYRLNSGTKYYGLIEKFEAVEREKVKKTEAKAAEEKAANEEAEVVLTPEQLTSKYIETLSIAAHSPQTLSSYNTNVLKEMKTKLETGELCL